jgi:hypothetical protein
MQNGFPHASGIIRANSHRSARSRARSAGRLLIRLVAAPVALAISLCADRRRGRRIAQFSNRECFVKQFIRLALVAGPFAAGIACAQEPSAPKEDATSRF